MELERRLMDVSGQLNSGKKPPKTKRKSWSVTSLSGKNSLILVLTSVSVDGDN